MKNFLDLLGTEPKLDITVNGIQSQCDLHSNLQFRVTDTVTIDGVEILPRYRYLADNDVLSIEEPFYQWLHKITGQGWLLKPYLTTNK